MQGNQLLCGRAITKRGGYVYDMATHSTNLDKFKTSQEKVDINFTMLLDWNDCPSTAQNYIMVKAARRFALDVDLDPGKIKFNEADEALAFGILQRDDLRNKQLNALNSPTTNAFLGALNSQNSFGGSGGLNPTGSHDYYE
jgi:hypothetical protein